MTQKPHVPILEALSNFETLKILEELRQTQVCNLPIIYHQIWCYFCFVKKVEPLKS